MNTQESALLHYGGAEARVLLHGAWLETYTINGASILFPKQTFTLPDGSKKVRGGCHVCLPNFGPGGESSLPQHGFGRELLWAVKKQDDASIVLGLSIEEGAYEGLRTTVKYELNTIGLQMVMTIENTGPTAMRLSPGFHPYFIHKESAIRVDGSSYPVDNLVDAVFMEGVAPTHELDELQLNLTASNLSSWVLWTDKLDDYVCLEPTYGSFGFMEGADTSQSFLLNPNDTWRADLTIRTSG